MCPGPTRGAVHKCLNMSKQSRCLKLTVKAMRGDAAIGLSLSQQTAFNTDVS